VREEVDFMHLPLFVRENAIVPMSGDGTRPTWGLADELTLHTFALADGASTATQALAADGLSLATFGATRQGAAVTFAGNGAAHHVRVLWRSDEAVVAAENGRLVEDAPEGQLIEWA